MLGRSSQFFYGAALVALPMVGVGVLAVTTGRDWGFGLQPSWIFLYLAVACGLLDSGRKGTLGSLFRSNFYLTKSLALILLVLAISGLGLLVAPSGEPALSAWGRFGRQAVQLLIMLGFVLWPAVWTRGPQRWRFTVKMLLVGAAIQVVYGLMQHLNYFWPGPAMALLEKIFTSNPAILSGSEKLYLGNAFLDVPRLRGTMCEPLYLGSYLLFVLPLVAWGRHWWRPGRVILGLLVLLLLLTWSRGAWLGFVFQMVVLVWLVVLRHKKTRGPSRAGLIPRRLLWGGAAALVVLGAAFLVSDWPVFQYPRDRLAQTFSSQDWSNLTRLFSMQAAWRAFLLSPVVGVGWGQFAYHFPQLVDPLGLQSQFTWPVVNNFPLEILCQTGVLGFLVFLFLGGTLVRRGFLVIERDTLSRAAMTAAALVAVLGVWIQLLTFSQYNLPHIWVSIGLLLAAIRDGHASNSQDAPMEDQP